MPNFLTDPDLFTYLKFGGHRSPGILQLKKHGRAINWDVKDGNAQAGASVSLKSISLVKFEATFVLSTRSEFDAWPAFAKVLQSTYQPKVQALEILHPELQEKKITSAVVANDPEPVPDGKGGKAYTVQFVEYKPPAKKSGSPKGSSTKGGPNAKPDPNAAAKAELAATLAQYKETKWG